MSGGRRRSNNGRCYYDLLGVPRDAGADEIKRAYRRAAVKHHPDKGGDGEMFKEVARAYQVLIDPSQRAVYDEHGEEGINEGMAAGDGAGGQYDVAFEELVATFRLMVEAGGADKAFGDVMEMLKNMLAGYAGDTAFNDVMAALKHIMARYGSCGEKVFDEFMKVFKQMMAGAGGGDAAGDVVQWLDVSLEDLYNGATGTFLRSRDVRCHICDGTGSVPAPPVACTACGGAGYKAASRQVMGFRLHRSAPCAACNGSGERAAVLERNRCPACGGARFVTDKKTLVVVIEQGMPDGHRITLAGEAPMKPGGLAGDVVMVLRQKKHERFKRKDDDLVYLHELSLAEALCGFQFELTHLDGRRLLVKSGPGEVIKPGQIKAIDGEGMPVHGRPPAKGTLYIAFRVAFPATVTPELREAVSAAFPDACVVAMEDCECEETSMRDVGAL